MMTNSSEKNSVSNASVGAKKSDMVRLLEENLKYTKSIHQLSLAGGDIKTHEELQKLLKQNLKISQDLYAITKKIHRWTSWQRVWGVVKLIIIVVPIILGIIYLPSLIQTLVAPYQELLNLGNSANNSVDGVEINQQSILQLLNQFTQ